ncbi:MAG: ABC transporter related protein [Parcubacteria group bacterium GW2011_GWB1_49_7]|uniref:ABC transporter n=1 Tax=Candidatus Zambryskibacteria bacterium RIFCSPHIGHO2_01_FULL_46_25 TaxID=1802738 RepID=A0A1G2T0G1_9BACT|nr:MAG: ABC transporter related protein [Parcubacteria group bacterium GW2011_GWA1_47_10]KKW09833.1 MAG: ABC transporter related protein [Parcubacteria group bacterium GW2011_GWB1_49_7]OHA90612.1 MAG: hypothetical protein A2838_02735 [Candidatus Zambryskibacteria bacterium RIFCSPHIGHO2_01_FULL_46_25]OHB01797.1 MAG: hypothetical protein A3F53_00640 [Candidatus Zambryskibacteria bacterium RIFCSPHIGHO2_12_FULL_48_10]OHB07255.1 MAG: hypothetical protein A3A31_01875 [Candidatus Zambryskibacteria bac
MADNVRERRNALLYLFGETWKYSAGNRDKIVWYWLMFIAANVIAFLCQPLAMAKIMDVIQKEGITDANFGLLKWLLVFTLAVELAFWSLHGPARCIERTNAFKARLNYRKYLLKGVMTLPLEWHNDHHSGDTIDKIGKGTDGLFSFAHGSFMPISSLAQLIVSLVMLTIFSGSRSLAIALVMIFVSGFITVRFDRKMISQYEELDHADNKIAESVHDAISNITTVIILRMEKRVFGTIMRKVEKPYDLFRRNQQLNEIKWFLTSLCCAVMAAAVLYTHFRQNIGVPKATLVGSTYLLMSYLGRISDLFFQFTNLYGDLVRYQSRMMNAEELALDFKEENFANHVLPKNWRQLKVENLCFSHRNGGNGELHLDNVSFSLGRGEHMAVIGPSGGGKTTLLWALRDLHRSGSVHLFVDGQGVAEGFGGISRDIALVPQDPEIFATTILENITMGEEYEAELIRHYSNLTCFTEVAEKLPKKFDSSIKEKGVNLSGGEQQRLALARGLLASHDKSIVLLDEPTSSLDAATEMKVYRNIFREFRDKTIVASVHRLHLLPMFDKILLFNGGRIIASGSFADLLANSPEFQELWAQYNTEKKETV